MVSPQSTFGVTLITNKLAIQSVAVGLLTVRVDAWRDEGSHSFLVTNLSPPQPSEPEATLL